MWMCRFHGKVVGDAWWAIPERRGLVYAVWRSRVKGEWQVFVKMGSIN